MESSAEAGGVARKETMRPIPNFWKQRRQGCENPAKRKVASNIE